MSDGTLPQRVNIRKAVTRNARYSGRLGRQELPAYSSQLADDDTALSVKVDFGTDDEGRQYVTVSMSATVELECQRCLQPVRQALHSESRLGLVATDEEAKHLPSYYEPLLAVDDVDLWRIAEEELALALPVVAYHPEGECKLPGGVELSPMLEDSSELADGDAEENPFSVLSTLLTSSDSKEI